jgi:hypothetical protein
MKAKRKMSVNVVGALENRVTGSSIVVSRKLPLSLRLM